MVKVCAPSPLHVLVVHHVPDLFLFYMQVFCMCTCVNVKGAHTFDESAFLIYDYSDMVLGWKKSVIKPSFVPSAPKPSAYAASEVPSEAPPPSPHCPRCPYLHRKWEEKSETRCTRSLPHTLTNTVAHTCRFKMFMPAPHSSTYRYFLCRMISECSGN